MEFVRPARLEEPAWAAIEQHAERASNQLAGDHAGMVGSCKDLVECVGKVVLAAATSPDFDDFPKIVKKASTLLAGATPRTDGDKEAGTLAKGLAMSVGSAFETAAQGLGELRNDHGAGHGRPIVPAISDEDVALVQAYTQAWVTWALARLERLLANSVTALIWELNGTSFRRGLLRQRLEHVGFSSLDPEEQERLGFAVAVRGGRQGTIVVREDGLDPLVEDGSWPLPYQFGVIKGLLLTTHGTLWPSRAQTVEAVLPRLTAEMQERLLDETENAAVSQGWLSEADAEKRQAASAALLKMATAFADPALRERWIKLAERVAVPS